MRKAIELANRDRAKPLPVPDITPSLRSPLGVSLPLHISLSRTLQFKTEHRDGFLNTLTASLRKAAVRPFDVSFTSLKWVPNYERNRWFLVLGVAEPEHNELNRLLGACNEAAEKSGQSGLYTGGQGDGPMESDSKTTSAKRRRSSTKSDRSGSIMPDRTENFHISIAWNLIEPAPDWIELVKQLPIGTTVDPASISFDAVKARVGNVVHNIQLSTRATSGRRGGGILGLG